MFLDTILLHKFQHISLYKVNVLLFFFNFATQQNKKNNKLTNFNGYIQQQQQKERE